MHNLFGKLLYNYFCLLFWFIIMKPYFLFICVIFLGVIFCNNIYAVTNTAKGQRIYEQYCHICHEPGLVGAPKFRNKAEWDERLAKKSLNELVDSALKGINAMPAQGTCYECSQDDLREAITYMIDHENK